MASKINWKFTGRHNLVCFLMASLILVVSDRYPLGQERSNFWANAISIKITQIVNEPMIQDNTSVSDHYLTQQKQTNSDSISGKEIESNEMEQQDAQVHKEQNQQSNAAQDDQQLQQMVKEVVKDAAKEKEAKEEDQKLAAQRDKKVVKSLSWTSGLSKGQVIGANIGILLAIILPVFGLVIVICMRIEKAYEPKGYVPMEQA